MNIFIYGVPGVGKTYYSRKLGKKLRLTVFEGDDLKHKAQKGKAKSSNPFLYLGTCKAYSQFGDLNKENAIQGMLAVRKALGPIIEQEIAKMESTILECTFLDPHLAKNKGRIILLSTLNEKNTSNTIFDSQRKIT